MRTCIQYTKCQLQDNSDNDFSMYLQLLSMLTVSFSTTLMSTSIYTCILFSMPCAACQDRPSGHQQLGGIQGEYKDVSILSLCRLGFSLDFVTVLKLSILSSTKSVLQAEQRNEHRFISTLQYMSEAVRKMQTCSTQREADGT